MSSDKKKKMKRVNEDRPPKELIELMGSWEDDPMEEPEELPWSLDTKRKPI